MNEKQMQIAIAEKCGWRNVAPYKDEIYHHAGIWGVNPNKGNLGEVPNYPFDLNACFDMDRKAEQDLMDADQWEQYGKELERQHPTAMARKVPPGEGSDVIDYYELANLITGLTPLQRCEAFCRVFWPERFL